jgi:HAE1 family hydrophobic/amphiphilic exporter-1
MTTVAMIAGMAPVALSVGGSSEFRAPMAIAVAGGLITSTALTLVIVPAVFTLIDDIESWLGPKIARMFMTTSPSEASQAPKPRPQAAG